MTKSAPGSAAVALGGTADGEIRSALRVDALGQLRHHRERLRIDIHQHQLNATLAQLLRLQQISDLPPSE